ncbi:hypothetical protein BpHYR1_036557 [Brachionus plicatilis]|uniref:Uncharacterized protein n=1 Tax=Brachionus plicatilis TaxID=10195 RepID=A0A3M7PYX3_BRAPC|nr:hypothetical protein BpHYR1_036557 [Brachionus plicatilis]
MGQNRRFHRTNYAFGIPHTNIWFEINPKPTEAHHVLQNVPATPRVADSLPKWIGSVRNLRLNANKYNDRKHNWNNK